eukprot:TRINITY_DN3092_c0_g1_i1.p1 TRINITY_DN3092_c0_g1~~TRINITY_DN3092_c0_g1_i1.p1  ORF type:complete len:174 (+),score=37.05 TRINITY_DN3092_c0_g1_i1:70-591(+)
MSHLYAIKSILILDSEGKRLAAKYYTGDYQTTKEQLEFEKVLFNKTHLTNSEVIMYDNNIGIYKNVVDVYFYVLGSYEENELILADVLNTLFESISILLRNQIDKRAILENLDFVLLAIDEIVDGGIIFESDPKIVASRVSMKSDDDTPLSEQTISQAINAAKEQLTRSLLKG